MINLSMPTIVTQLTSAATTKLTMFATNSLAKSAKQATNNQEELIMWGQQQDDKLEAKITSHLTRKRSTELELAAIAEWRKSSEPLVKPKAK